MEKLYVNSKRHSLPRLRTFGLIYGISNITINPKETTLANTGYRVLI